MNIVLAKQDVLPTDIWSVKRIGTEAWRALPFVWPVSDAEFKSLMTAVEELVTSVTLQSEPYVRDIWLTLHKLGLEYAIFLQSAMVADRAREHNLPLLYPNKCPSSRYYRMADGAEVAQGEVSQPLMLSSPGIPSFRRRLLRQLYLPIVQRRIRSRRRAELAKRSEGLADKTYLSLFQPNSMAYRYAASYGANISVINAFRSLGLRRSGNPVSPSLKESIQGVMDGLLAIAGRYNTTLGPACLDYLYAQTCHMAQIASISAEAMQDALAKQRGRTILATRMGNTTNRLFYVTARRRDFSIVGLAHGNSANIFRGSGLANIDLAICDTYVTESAGAAALAERSRDSYPLSSASAPRVIALEDGHYTRMHGDLLARPKPDSIRRVMLLEYPITPFRHQGSQLFWPYQVDMAIRLGETIRQLGKEATIKRHPDRLAESEGVYEHFFDHVVSERFEEVWQNADLFVFPNIASTAFGIAVLTNRPIIIFEHVLDDIWPDVRVHLRRRCRVIPSWVDEGNRIQWDEQDFKDAIEAPPGETDDSFARKYLDL